MSINPVRYPGGKGKKYIVDQIINAIGVDTIQNHNWIEPFCGGCGLGLELVNRKLIKTATFSDSDMRIMAMWKQIAYNTENLITRINATPITMETFQLAKKVANDTKQSVDDIGFATLILNRCCRSGYIDGGVIGGNAQSGKYKVDSRFNKKTVIKNIATIGKMANNGLLHFTEPHDALFVIKNIITDVKMNKLSADNIFLYLDPPYIGVGRRCYKQKTDDKLLCQLLNEANDVDIRWLLSYDDCLEIRNMYKNMNMTYLNMTYSNNTKTRGKTAELLICN